MRNVAALPEIPEVVGGGLPDISEIAKRTPVIKVIRWVGEKILGCLHWRVIRSTGGERYLQPRKNSRRLCSAKDHLGGCWIKRKNEHALRNCLAKVFSLLLHRILRIYDTH